VLNVNVEEKNDLLQYYIGSVCVCEKQKLAQRWVCLKCRGTGLVNEESWAELKTACEKHLSVAQKILGHYKNDYSRTN
jgi:hypothetical protein